MLQSLRIIKDHDIYRQIHKDNRDVLHSGLQQLDMNNLINYQSILKSLDAKFETTIYQLIKIYKVVKQELDKLIRLLKILGIFLDFIDIELFFLRFFDYLIRVVSYSHQMCSLFVTYLAQDLIPCK